MRELFDSQNYFDFTLESRVKIVRDYRADYARMNEVLEKMPELLVHVHTDLSALSISEGGRRGTFTTEHILRAVLVHAMEGWSLRETVIRVAESQTLQTFVRLGGREMMDFSLLSRAVNALSAETWTLLNGLLCQYAAGEHAEDFGAIRVDSTVIETNIHYPTDSSLLWDCWRVVARLLRQVRDARPDLCPHRFHDQKAKDAYLFIARFIHSNSKNRQRAVKRQARFLIEQVERILDIAVAVARDIDEIGTGLRMDELALLEHAKELRHYVPLCRRVTSVARRALLQGESVPATDRVFSIFEDHTELIKRGKARKPVEFGHCIWLAQSDGKLITDYEVMDEKIPDSDLLLDIVNRHEYLFGAPPEAVAADTGFRAAAEEMTAIEERVSVVAVPKRGGRTPEKPPKEWSDFRAGIEGCISVLKRAFRLRTCMYKGFKHFASAVGMAIFAHNLRVLARRAAPA